MALSLLGLACAPAPAPPLVRCPAGSVATNAGCWPVPRFGDAGRATDGATPAADAEPTDAGTAAEAGPADRPEPPLSLAGTWGLGLWSKESVLNSSVGEPQQVPLSELARAELDPTGRLRFTTCAFEPGRYADYTTLYPPSALVAMGPVEGALRLEPRPGGAFAADELLRLVGWEAAQPGQEAMPASAEDSRVGDPDRDQAPGVSLRILGPVEGEVWVVQRQRYALSGVIAEEGLIAGSLRLAREHVVLGAAPQLLALGQITIDQLEDPAESGFRLVRLEPGADCARVLAERARLLP